MKSYMLIVEKTFKDWEDLEHNTNHFWEVVHRDAGWGKCRMQYGPFKTRKIARKFRKELDRVLYSVDYYKG